MEGLEIYRKQALGWHCNICRTCSMHPDGTSAYPVNNQIARFSTWTPSQAEHNYGKDYLFNFKLWIVPVQLGAHLEMMVIIYFLAITFKTIIIHVNKIIIMLTSTKSCFYLQRLDCLSGLHVIGHYDVSQQLQVVHLWWAPVRYITPGKLFTS